MTCGIPHPLDGRMPELAGLVCVKSEGHDDDWHESAPTHEFRGKLLPFGWHADPIYDGQVRRIWALEKQRDEALERAGWRTAFEREDLLITIKNEHALYKDASERLAAMKEERDEARAALVAREQELARDLYDLARERDDARYELAELQRTIARDVYRAGFGSAR